MMRLNSLVMAAFFLMAIMALYSSIAPPSLPMSTTEDLAGSFLAFQPFADPSEAKQVTFPDSTSSPDSTRTDVIDDLVPNLNRIPHPAIIKNAPRNASDLDRVSSRGIFILPEDFPRPPMPLKLSRPHQDQFVDVYQVTSRCDFHLATTQQCLDYLNSQSKSYLVKREEGLPPCDEDHPMLYHAYWRGLMGPPVSWMLKSFLFTQNLDCSRYILWVDAANTPLDLDDIDRKAAAERWQQAEDQEKRNQAYAAWEILKENATRHNQPFPPPPLLYTQSVGHNHSTHATALREILVFEPYITIKRFNLSDTLIKTLRLTPEELDDFIQSRDYMPPPPSSSPEADLATTQHLNMTESSNSSNSSNSSKLNSTSTHPTEAPSKTPSTDSSRQIVGPKVLRFNWPVHLLNPKSNLNGNAVSDSDLVRFILLDVYGGMYVDTDVLFLRDMRPYYYMPANWAYAWSMWNYYNTAFLMFQRHSSALFDIISKGIANDMKFHPRELLGYLRGPDGKHLSTLTGEHQLAMFPSAIFDTMWTYVDGNRKAPILPTFNRFNVLFEETCDREKEFAVLLDQRGQDYVRDTPIRELRTLDRFMAGAPANHFHGIVHRIERDSWAQILLEHFNCFLAASCPNIYGELLQYSFTTH